MPTAAPPPQGLDEVERAISALDGRHPQHERSRRETLAAAEERRQQLEKELARKARRRLLRVVVIGANVVAIATAGVVFTRLTIRSRAIRDSLETIEAPFVSHGMVEIASNWMTASPRLDADVPATSCFVAVAGGAHLQLREGSRVVDSDGSLGWCSCPAHHVSLEACAGSQTAPVALALLRVDGRTTGGPLARKWTDIRPKTWSDDASSCSDAMLDGWITEHHFPPAVDIAQAFEKAPYGSSLERAGFHAVSGVPEGQPFSLVTAAAGDCILALSDGDPLSVREVAEMRIAFGGCTSPGEIDLEDLPTCCRRCAAISPRIACEAGGRRLEIEFLCDRLAGARLSHAYAVSTPIAHVVADSEGERR